METASIVRRLACLLYDAMLLLAVLFLAGFAVVGLLPDVQGGAPRLLFQAYLFLVAGAYLTGSWRRGGQTLAMKTWRVRLVDLEAGSLSWSRLWLRYCLAVLGLLVGGIGFLWALFDRDGQFLHDHLLGMRLVQVAKES
jgi:uncharacterized RDD family membrane protein YckC